MFIGAISVCREGYYPGSYTKPDLSRPFKATIEVHGLSGKMELHLSPELSAKVVEIIADEIVSASRATAEAMTAEVLNVVALPSPKTA